MRIAVFAKSKARTQTTRSIARALERAGHSLCVIREAKRRQWVGRRLAERWATASVRRFAPDFALIHARDVSRRVLAGIAGRVPTVMFTPDCWPSPIAPDQLGLAADVDLLCTVARGQVAEFERAGVARAAYLAEAHDPDLYYPVDTAEPAFRSEVAFIGKYARDSHLHATRGALIPAVAARFDLKLYGGGWRELGLAAARGDVYPEQYRAICRGAGIVLGCDWRYDVPWYFSNRTWFTLGARGFLLTNHVPGLEEIFENHRHLVWYRSVDECLALIEHYRARPEERARIAAEGHAFARAHRTYDDFARDLVDLFEGREPKFPPRVGAA
ncbi:MAG TPA: glycosyltransferase [Myxococcota bacterium]|nr:glycosyltransferase [Myxococcota bacterium]